MNKQKQLGDLLASHKTVDVIQAITGKPAEPEIDLKRITTPLQKAVAHLLKIGSTNKYELQDMAEEFVTKEAACKKLGLDYDFWKAFEYHAQNEQQEYMEAKKRGDHVSGE